MARFRSTLLKVTNLKTGRVSLFIEKCGRMQRVSPAEYQDRYMMFYTPDGTLESVHSSTGKYYRREYCTVVWSEKLKGE